MAKIKVKLYATLKEMIGRDAVFVEADTVRQVIEKLINEYSTLRREIVNDDLSLKDDYIYLVNKRNIVFLQKEDTRLNEGDKVTIFPQVGGG